MRAAWSSLDRHLPSALILFLAASLLYTVSRWNYLLFHTFIEVISVEAAWGIFMVSWNTRRTLRNGYLLFLGQAYLFIGALDLLHMLTYKGMGVFPGRDANLPTQLWIAARAFEGLSLLVAPLFLTRHFPLGRALLGSGCVAAALAAAVFSGRYFPDCFVEGRGLTPFKIGSEYAIVLTLIGALALLRRRRELFEPTVLAALSLALLVKVGAELSFTLYTDVYGLSNLAGHLLKLASFWLIYRALVVTGIARPFDLLFRDLKRGEEALQAENARLAAAQEALRKKNEQLAALVARKNELLGVAAHDIRSPLSAMAMYGSLLSRKLAGKGDAEGLGLLEIIQRTNRRALDMVSDVLDLTAIESGRLQLEPRLLDLRALVEECLETHRCLAEGKGIALDAVCEGELPPVPVDPLRFQQVLSNLIANALKFSPAGTRVTIREFRHNGAVCVAVQDQGCGIPPEDREMIFQPFATAAPKGTTRERSTGLGLAIVRKIVASHGGSVELESEVGRGSTFTVRFPLRPPEAGPAIAESGRGERI